MSYDSIQPKMTPSAEKLLERHAASKLAAKDPSLFDFSEEVEEFAAGFMGWSTLSTKPPHPLEEISRFAEEVRAQGLDDVLLLGQGGSTQAAMTMAEFLRDAGQLDIGFHTMDSMSSEYFNKVWNGIDPARTIFVVSSKSGSTLEPISLFRCVWERVCDVLGHKQAGSRFVAITDPGSKFDKVARELGFAAVFPGEPTVGGRFSALSVFGLVPYALMGMDLEQLVDACADAERLCSIDEVENPALQLASFIKECHIRGRNKISFNFSAGTKSFGLWLEQLIAESTGKEGRGILPNTEHDESLLEIPCSDRSVIVYTTPSEDGKPDSYGCSLTAEERCERIWDAGNPSLAMSIDSPVDAACHMVVWEFAVSMFCALIGLNPFDQPDVETTKKAVREILKQDEDGSSSGIVPLYKPVSRTAGIEEVEFELTPMLSGKADPEDDLETALETLLGSIGEGDFFSVNAFLPSFDEARMSELEQIRHCVAETYGCASCLEIGPRYLHSIGQFQKGGYNKGVYLLIASAEAEEVQVPGRNYSLTSIACAQARGDFTALGAANRRAMIVYLTDNSPEALHMLASNVRERVPSGLS